MLLILSWVDPTALLSLMNRMVDGYQSDIAQESANNTNANRK
jgi:hypothetical protein